MNKYKGFSKMWFLVLLLVAFVAGCASNGGDPGTLVSIKVSPATSSIPVTGTLQYTALAIFGDGSARDVTGSAAWTAGTTGVSFGAIKGLATGATANVIPVVITATYNGKITTSSLTVNAATSKGLKLSPATASIPVTGNQQYTLLEIFSDGTSQLRTTDLATTWSTTNNAGNVSLTPNGLTAGLASGLIATPAGTPVTITATYGGNTTTANLTVNAATSKFLLLSPATASIPVTGNQQYTLLEVFSDGTSQTRTTNLATTWSTTNNSGNVSLTPIGLTAGLASGLVATPAGTPVTITAAYGGKTATANLTVNAATSKSLMLSPATASIPVTGNQQYTLLEIFTDGTSQLRTADLATSWSLSNNAGNVSLTPSGLTAGIASGIIATPAGTPVTINATYSGKTVTANLTVNAATSKFLMLTPAIASIPVSGTQQYTLLEVFSDGTSQPRTNDLATVWTTTNNAGNVSLTPSGLTAGLASGLIATPAGTPVTVTAAYGGNTISAALTVNAATSKSFKVTPLTATISINGGGQQFAAIETFTDGSTIDRTADLATTWSSVDLSGGPGVSIIGLHTGIATGATIGTSTITATYVVGVVTKTGTAVLTVTAPNPGAAGKVDLGTAGTYGVMSNSGMTLSAPAKSHIYGDVGILANSTFTGFTLNLAAPTATSPTSAYVTGQITSGPNATTGYNNVNFGAMVTAFNDLNAAWIKNNPTNNPAPATAPTGALPTGGTFVAAAQDLTGMLLGPGIYASNIPTGTLALSNASGPLVLDAGGNQDAIFIFQASDITTTSGSVILRNGAQSKNVFWVLTKTATIGDGTTATSFTGTILAGTAVTVGLNTSVEGRVLAGAGLVSGILTINGGVITVP